MPEEVAAPPRCAAARDLEAFDAWASRHRRRAALDGARRVEVTERVWRGAVTRTVTTWHNAAHSAVQQPQSKRRELKVGGKPAQQQQQRPSRQQQQQQQYEQRPLRQQLQQPNSKQRRSAKRSAEHHARVRALRAVGLVGCFVVRLQAALALRRAASPTQGPEAWEMEAIVDLAKSKDKEGLRLFSEQLGITPGAREVAADALAAW